MSYGSSDRYDFDRMIENSIKAQRAAIDAYVILALARMDRRWATSPSISKI